AVEAWGKVGGVAIEIGATQTAVLEAKTRKAKGLEISGEERTATSAAHNFINLMHGGADGGPNAEHHDGVDGTSSATNEISVTIESTTVSRMAIGSQLARRFHDGRTH